jgi:hypothetical protein
MVCGVSQPIRLRTIRANVSVRREVAAATIRSVRGELVFVDGWINVGYSM